MNIAICQFTSRWYLRADQRWWEKDNEEFYNTLPENLANRWKSSIYFIDLRALTKSNFL